MDVLVEKRITDAFLKIVEKHGNGKWAKDELNYLVFEVHKGEFEKLSEEDKDAVRRVMNAYDKIYG